MTRKFLNGIDGGAQRAQNFADASSATDLATKQQLDNMAAGFKLKVPVRVASTANVTLASALTNGSSMDGVTLATGDRVLLKNQTAPAENGIYPVVASGATTRVSDADSASELNGALVTVNEGTVAGDTMWYQTGEIVTINTTAVAWAKFAPGVSVTAGNGISVSSGVVTAVAEAGKGLSVAAGGIGVDRTKTPQLFATNIGDNSTTAITVTHNLGTLDVQVVCREISTGAKVEPDDVAATTNTVTLTFAVAPTTNQHRAIVFG